MKTLHIVIEKTTDHYSGYAENHEGIYGGGSTVYEVKESIVQSIKIQQEENPNFLKGGYKVVYKF